MPLKSKSQLGALFAKERAGQLKPGTAQEFYNATPNFKSLPERVNKKRSGSGAITGSGRSTSRKQSPAATTSTTSTTSSSANNISAPSKLGIARKLPDFTASISSRKSSGRTAATPPIRPLTLPRTAGNRYARRGVPRSQMRSYGRSS